MSLVDTPNLDILKSAVIDNEISLNKIFLKLINELTTYLNLDVINKNYKVQCVAEIENLETDAELLNYGVLRFVKGDILYIKLYKSFKKYYPFFLLLSAYTAFVPDILKNSTLVNFALNQFVEIDLQGFELIDEWKLLSRQKYISYSQEKALFRFDKFLENCTWADNYISKDFH